MGFLAEFIWHKKWTHNDLALVSTSDMTTVKPWAFQAYETLPSMMASPSLLSKMEHCQEWLCRDSQTVERQMNIYPRLTSPEHLKGPSGLLSSHSLSHHVPYHYECVFVPFLKSFGFILVIKSGYSLCVEPNQEFTSQDRQGFRSLLQSSVEKCVLAQ